MTDDIKRQPLPWFAFNIGEYLKDTMRLSRDAHGAYLLLMLDYYGAAKPCPDDDFILAAVTKSTEAEWKSLRKMLEPFFDIRDGHWYHKRIEREMLEAGQKLATSLARAKAGGEAFKKKKAAERAAAGETVAPKPQKPRKQASRRLEATPQATPEARLDGGLDEAHKHLHIHTTTPFGRSSSARAREDDDATDAALAPDLEEEDDIGTTIAPDWRLDASQVELCLADGLTEPSEVETQVRLFKAYNVNKDTFSTNWINTWSLWWQRHLERRQKAAAAKSKPRIVVDTTAEAKEPTDEEWERHLIGWKRDNSRWSRWIGPSPGLTGCRCPPHILIKHGLDPKTALPLRATTT